MEPSYESVVRSPDGLAWEMKGATVKAMTEEDFFKVDGSRDPHRSDQSNRSALGRYDDQAV